MIEITKIVPYDQKLLFDIIWDVKKYPEFLPLFKKAEVERQKEDSYTTVQTLGFGLWTKKVRTRTSNPRPGIIKVESVSGEPLIVNITWELKDTGDGATTVKFTSGGPHTLLNLFQSASSEVLVEAFLQRARQLSAERI